MSGWNRLFVLIAVCWAAATPFWLVAENNNPVESAYSMCTDTAYQIYGTSSAPQTLNMEKYRAEMKVCFDRMARNLIGIQTVFGAMFGIGRDIWLLGLLAWGSFLIPLALLWVAAWGIGRAVRWVVAGFRQTA
jgi:hypothetical protein